MKTWSSVITYTVFLTGAEYETEEEYKEWVKETFKENHEIYLRDDEIAEIEGKVLIPYYKTSNGEIICREQ